VRNVFSLTSKSKIEQARLPQGLAGFRIGHGRGVPLAKYREHIREALVRLVGRELPSRLDTAQLELWRRHVVEGQTREKIANDRLSENDLGTNRLLRTEKGITAAYREDIVPVVVEIVSSLLIDPDLKELETAFEKGRAAWPELGPAKGPVREFHGTWVQEFHDREWFDAALVYNRRIKQAIPVRNGFGGHFLRGRDVASRLGPPVGPEYDVTERASSYGHPGMKPHVRQDFENGGLAWHSVNTGGKVEFSSRADDFATG